MHERAGDRWVRILKSESRQGETWGVGQCSSETDRVQGGES